MRIFFLATLLFILGSTHSVFAQENPLAGEVNLAGVKIEIKRDGFSCGCTECCPKYKMSIDGNGMVNFEGESAVKLKGKYVFSVPVKQVKDLLADFRRVNFFSLENEYRTKRLPNGEQEYVDHSNGTTITLTVGGTSKSVFNFYGAPDELNALQKKLDKISQDLQQ